jgi:hypothetical protein
MIPVAPDNSCTLLVPLADASEQLPHIVFSNPQTEAQVQYAASGLLSEADCIDNQSGETAGHMLLAKITDPIGAAVSAYFLLKTGKLDRLRDWTATLAEDFDWLADGLVIRGEHLARLGRHEEAFHIFLRLRERGLPLFSAGFSFALNWLGQYRTNWDALRQDAKGQLPDQWQDEWVSFFNTLTQIALHIDFSRPILTCACKLDALIEK